MAFEITHLESLNQRLWDYDVRDGGWENEHRDPAFNAFHVSEEVRNTAIGRKSFLNPVHVTREIAPDAMLYTLRLARWFDISVEDIEIGERGAEALETVRQNQVPMPEHMLRYNAAGLILGQAAHDAQHDNLKEQTLRELPINAQSASGLLLHCADLQVREFDIDFDEVYDARIAELRVRFNKPEPDL